MSAVNAALPACAAARLPPHEAAAVQQSIDVSYSPSRQQQTRRTLLQGANGTDRRTDGHRAVTYHAAGANKLVKVPVVRS